jgi:hypothetical protein
MLTATKLLDDPWLAAARESHWHASTRRAAPSYMPVDGD